MKKTIIGFSFILISLFSYEQGFYQLSFKNINGDSISLNSYSGKKVFFFIAPLSSTDSNFAQLQNFKNRYLDTVQVIGVLSYEAGYQNSDSSSIKALYNNMGIVLTAGMYTKKSSGANQSSIMKWLTDKNQNHHFDMDASGVGHKFFVTGGGRLFAVMPVQTSLQSGIINIIVHSTGL